jgi:hypothetical protein
MRLIKRTIQAAVFISLHAAVAIVLMSFVAPSWVVGGGIIAAAFGTLLLFLLAGDEQSARLFFFENWGEIETSNSPNVGLVFVLIGCVWLLPVFCLLFALVVVALGRLFWS